MHFSRSVALLSILFLATLGYAVTVSEEANLDDLVIGKYLRGSLLHMK